MSRCENFANAPRNPAMPIPPIRRSTPAPASSKAQPDHDAAAPETADESTGSLTFGAAAQTQVKVAQQQAAMARDSAREFFITKAECAAAKAKGEAGVTVRVHFVRNYANKAEIVCAPRVTIMDGVRPESFTSPGPDCAIAAAGVPVSMRPVYLLIDHRGYQKQDGTKGGDDLKLWIPPPVTMGVMENAIKNLAENIGADPTTLDITRFEAKITKIGEGRSTAWAIDFVSKPVPQSQAAINNVQKALKDGYKTVLTRWLAPNPRYMLSKGGTYTKPAKNGGYAEEGQPPPY